MPSRGASCESHVPCKGEAFCLGVWSRLVWFGGLADELIAVCSFTSRIPSVLGHLQLYAPGPFNNTGRPIDLLRPYITPLHSLQSRKQVDPDLGPGQLGNLLTVFSSERVEERLGTTIHRCWRLEHRVGESG